MSAYRTVRITRTKARVLAMQHIMTASDSLLEEIVGDILRERLYNCRVVDDREENDEEKVGL